MRSSCATSEAAWPTTSSTRPGACRPSTARRACWSRSDPPAKPRKKPGLAAGPVLRERAGLRNTTIIDISLVAGELSIFDTLFKNIIAKLLDNVSYVLERYRHSDGALVLPAAFESALDIRGLIAPRLAALAKGTRWSHRLDLSPSEKPASPTLTRTLRPTLRPPGTNWQA